MDSFGARLRRALETRGPLCVGIDPHAGLLNRWGLPDTPDGLRSFCDTVVEALAGRVAVVKPQSAFYERFGAAGVAILESTIRHSRQAGAIVITDVKRGDIGSTAQAYAQAYLDPSRPLHSDAITVSPYLGFGAVLPMIDEAEAHGGGVFLLAFTSNPEGPEVQQARSSEGVSVGQNVIDKAAARNAGATPLGSIGVVIGATAVGPAPVLDHLNGPVLVPGMGTQGGRPEDLRAVFEGLTGAVLPSYSREILGHGPSIPGLRDAADRALDACRNVLT